MRSVLSGSAAILLLSYGCFAQVSDPPAAGATAPLDHSMLLGTWNRVREPGDREHVSAVTADLLHLNKESKDTRASPVVILAELPPLKPQYMTQWVDFIKRSHEADERGQPLATGYSHCLPDGMPTMMQGMFPMEVLQAPGDITILEEAYRQIRHIYLNQKQITPITDAEPGFWGHSVGHWEGNTLRVNTVGIREEVRVEGVPHSDQMQIDEKIELLTPDTFKDAITVTDPVYLTGPWSFTWHYKREKGYKILEYVCEDNREESDSDSQKMNLSSGPTSQH